MFVKEEVTGVLGSPPTMGFYFMNLVLRFVLPRLLKAFATQIFSLGLTASRSSITEQQVTAQF